MKNHLHFPVVAKIGNFYLPNTDLSSNQIINDINVTVPSNILFAIVANNNITTLTSANYTISNKGINNLKLDIIYDFKKNNNIFKFKTIPDDIIKKKDGVFQLNLYFSIINENNLKLIQTIKNGNILLNYPIKPEENIIFKFVQSNEIKAFSDIMIENSADIKTIKGQFILRFKKS